MSATLALLAAHALGDFPLQPTWMATEKFTSWEVRALHTLVHFFLAVIFLLPIIEFRWAWTAAAAVAVLHFVIDSRRWVSEDAGGFDGYPMAVDQTLHLVSLYLVSVVILA